MLDTSRALPDGRSLAYTDFDIDTARAIWAFAHGMVILELNNRFPPDADLDAAWRGGLKTFGAP